MQRLLREIRKNGWFFAAILLLVALRLYHFTPEIDWPHDWRQCDTAHYIDDFYENGIDLLKPSVCWMGGHETLLLEFPLFEAIVSVFYQITGPQHNTARAVTLAFFLGAVGYLFAIVRHLHSPRLARITALVYLALPLSLFYSRAIQIDFAAVFFSHAMLYYFIIGIDLSRTRYIVLGSLMGTLGFLIKAPYVFYLYIPLIAHLRSRRPSRSLMLGWLPLFVLPALPFIAWTVHMEQVNALAPDWSAIPGFFKYIDRGDWYFGPLLQRAEPVTWLFMLYRFTVDVCGLVGLPLFLYGLYKGWHGKVRHKRFFRLWLLGTLVYLLVFYNLNIVHNYYQIPFLAVFAFFIALAIDRLVPEEGMRMTRYARPALAAGLLVLACVATSERHYYHFDHHAIMAGQIVQKQTADHLVIAAQPERRFDDPRLLYRSNRDGWSVDANRLDTDLLHYLHGEGAKYLVLLSDQGVPHHLRPTLNTCPSQSFELGGGMDLHIYELNWLH